VAPQAPDVLVTIPFVAVKQEMLLPDAPDVPFAINVPATLRLPGIVTIPPCAILSAAFLFPEFPFISISKSPLVVLTPSA